MSGLIRIDPPSLTLLAKRLGAVAADTGDLPKVSACQSFGVTDALEKFGLELEVQREGFQKSLRALADGVLGTADEFSEFEESLRTSLDSAAEGLK